MATNGHPATPPPSDPSSKAESQTKAEPEVPLTSTQDDGLSKRPRDARLVHVILSSLGIHSYQERVPLQLLDFAYRYTSGILSDSLRLSAEGYTSQADRGNRRGASDDSGVITIQALRQAIASRQGYTFQGPLAKEFMMEQAEQRNRVALPRIDRSLSMQLPPEKYCLTGVGWNLKEEWDSDEDVPDEEALVPVAAAAANKEDEQMGGVDEEEEDGDEEGAGRMEDVFGADAGGDTKMDED
jgi:transcription initiation factor TFIID subunit 9B